MRCIAIASQKGGSAKTTTTVNLAAALVERGRRVLLIDLDPQANSSDWIGFNANASDGAFALLTGRADLDDVVCGTGCAGVDAIPATKSLTGIERALAGEVGAEMTLRRKLPAASDRWDYILIDTPPTLGILTLNALSAAQEVIVPVAAHVLALAGVAQLMDTIAVVRDRLNPGLSVAGLVACRVDYRTRHCIDVVTSLRDTFGSKVYPTEIRENIRLAEAPSFKQSILQYAGASPGAADYRALAGDVLGQE